MDNGEYGRECKQHKKKHPECPFHDACANLSDAPFGAGVVIPGGNSVRDPTGEKLAR
jgi:hypothetical protein